jgi:hypothetical protein
LQLDKFSPVWGDKVTGCRVQSSIPPGSFNEIYAKNKFIGDLDRSSPSMPRLVKLPAGVQVTAEAEPNREISVLFVPFG